METIEKGFCQCGCGELVEVAKYTSRKIGWIKGEPKRFIRGHNTSKDSIPRGWKGGKTDNGQGYSLTMMKDHPKASKKGYVKTDILIAERALGKILPTNAIVHHFPKLKGCTALVICENRPYHIFLHQRHIAFISCGHANWKRCLICKQFDDPNNMMIYEHSSWHKNCFNTARKEKRHKAKALNLGFTAN